MLVAFDDLLVARLRCCTLCGRPKAAQHAVVAITQGRTGQTLHIAYGLCEPCAARQGWRQALHALFGQRYLTVRERQDVVYG
jgi:hypothetical protein